MSECITAVATANGTGGVAIIRISGDNALDLAKRIFTFSHTPKSVASNRMYSGKIMGDGFEDFGFLVYFKAPNSFTGEDTVEFHCHGGVRISQGILKTIYSLGARPAERGEFTRRAFLNGKLTLASAEGMADMINAESLALVRAGGMMYFGKLNKDIKILQDDLKDILARVAVEIDYPEEDEGGIDLGKICADLTNSHGDMCRLLQSYGCGKKIKNGVTVAICGKPNAGKSSLLNALLGYEKAIVSSEAGTTRDAVEGQIEIDGILFNLVDTAGIRESAGKIESMGIERAKNILRSADIVLSLADENGFAMLPETDGRVIEVFSKCDIGAPQRQYDAVVSSKTGEGIEELKKLLAKSAVGEFASDKAYIIEQRHYDALKRAEGAIASALENIATLTLDLIRVDLQEAWQALGEITGETASEEIVSTIFAKFCVGK